MNKEVDKTLLLAPNFIKDVYVNFGELHDAEGERRRKLTIELEVNDDEANKMLSIPGMDEFQLVAFMTPCIQVAILKTIMGQGGNNVKIEEMQEGLAEGWSNMENPFAGKPVDEHGCFQY